MSSMRAAIAAAALAMLAASPRSHAATLDLAETLRQVTARSPMLAARAAMVDAARLRASAAGAWPSPMVEAGVVNVPANGRFDMDPMTMKMLGVMQTVPVFGARGLARRAGLAGVTAERAGAELARYQALGMAWRMYCDAYYAGELVRLVLRHRDIAGRAVQSARVRYQSGRGRLDDVMRSQAERAMFEADVAMFAAEEREARAQLDALRGIAPGDAAPRDSLATPPDTALAGSADAWLGAITAAHPRVGASAAATERYRLEARAMRRRLWPDLEVRYSYGWRQPVMGIEQDDMFNASVGVMLPVFGSMRAEAAGMDAMARAGERERLAAELDLRAEVVAAHAMASSARWRAGLLADTVVVLQRRALEASWSAYGAGGGDLWRVLEAAHALYDDEVALLRARKDFAHAAARLVALTGRTDLLGVPAPPGGER